MAVKINELATSAISLSDFLAKADASGIATKTTIQSLSNFLGTVGTLGFKGVLLSGDATVTEDGIYVAGDAGTYTNNGGLVITVNDKIVLISVTSTQTVFEKAEFPISLTIDAVPTSGSTNAVESGGVFDALALKADQTQVDNIQTDLDALGVDINGGVVVPTFSFVTTGGINVTTGADATSTGQKRTGYIDINGADSLTYANLRGFEGTTFSMLYLYDESYVGIASIVANNTSGTIRTGTVDLKNNYPTARYYRMALNANPGYIAAVTSTLIYLGAIASLEDDISINATNIATNETNIESNLTEINIIKDELGVKRNKIYTENLLDSGNITIATARTQPNLYASVVSGLPNSVFRGSSPFVVGQGSFPDPNYITPNVRRFTSYTIEFLLNGRYLEIAGRESSWFFSLMVDGVIVVKNYNATVGGYDALGKTWVNVDLGEVKSNAHVKIIFYNKFGGVATEGTIAPFVKTRKKLIMDGDSIVEGAGSGNDSAPNIFSYAGVLSYLLDMDLYNAAVGGSGFTALGNAGEPNLGGRFTEYVQPYDCDYFAFSAGLNDGYITYSTTVEDAVIAYFEQVYEAYKNSNTQVIVISPFQPLNATKEASLGINGIRDKEKELCLQYRWGFIDIIDGITYDGIGNVIQDSSLTLGGIWDNGRKATMDFDGTHPNPLGHNYMGYRVMEEMYRLIG